MTIEIEDAFAIELHRIAERIKGSVVGEFSSSDDTVYIKKLKVNFGEYVALSKTTFQIRKEFRKEIGAIGDLPF